MSFKYKNEKIADWLSAHHAVAEENCEMAEKVELLENVWHMDDGAETSGETSVETSDEASDEVSTVKEQEEQIVVQSDEAEENPVQEEVQKNVDMDAYNPLYSGQSERIKQLKKKKIWIFINPFYRVYATVKVKTILFLRKDKKSFFIRIKNKILNKWRNRKSVIRKRNRMFIRSITYSPEKLKKQRETKFSKNVKFSVVVPLFNTPEQYLRDMIESVLNQTYENLELCLGDASDAKHVEKVAQICREYAAKDARVHYEKLEKNAGIAENTNRCIEMTTGDYIALLDHDDMYHPGALFACMECIEKENAEFVYTDEMTFEKDKIENVATLHFKPDFSMQNLKGVNYICHLCVFKKSLLDQTGMFDDTYNGSQDHDIILKLTTAAKVVSHIPEILYFWRVHPQSVSMNINAKSYAIDAGRAAVRDSEKRAGRDAEVFSSCICATHYRLEYQMPKEERVSIIILNHNAGTALAKLVDSIGKRTEYSNYEIIIADMDSSEKETEEYLSLIEGEDQIFVLRMKTASVSEAVNRSVEKASGSCVVFLESHMEIVKAGWLKRLVPYAMQEEIGVIGQKMADSHGMLREAGYIAGLGEDGIALPIERGSNYDTIGYMGRMYYVHNVSLVSIWGMMVKKAEFEAAGGLDEKLTTDYAGFDFCLRELGQKKQVALDPYVITLEHDRPLAQLEKEESVKNDQAYMRDKWKAFFEKGDPYYNKHLAKDGSFTYDYK